jgi:hypothetical protein
VIPCFDTEVDASIPPDLMYWTPRSADIDDEEGFGGFQGTWALGRMSAREAGDLLAADVELVSIADELVDDELVYEDLARALESSDHTSVPHQLRTGAAWERLEPHVDGMELRLGGLELGVAGLVGALAAIGGCFPAASCRAHAEHSWSPYPVVLLAADRHRVETLAPLVAASGCGFAVDPYRPALVAIMAGSVVPMLELGQKVLSDLGRFRRARGAPRRRAHPRTEQGTFEFGSS